jgi:hypothetical protein
MTMTNPTGVAQPRIDTERPVRQARMTTDQPRSWWRETKPSAKTTELWLTLVGIAVLAIVYNASRDASLNLFRVCLLGTIGVSAYLVSRGLAKSGSHLDDDVRDEARG